MENFTPYSALLGGLLIGLSTAIMLFWHGRVTGISGMVGGLVNQEMPKSERGWRMYFIGGLVLGTIPMLFAFPEQFVVATGRSDVQIAVAGLLVGVGTHFGSGCTSGHGVCGLGRGSTRSIVATPLFIATGALMVYAMRVFGAAQ